MTTDERIFLMEEESYFLLTHFSTPLHPDHNKIQMQHQHKAGFGSILIFKAFADGK